jgi:PiT family inorganic phosphate transporter
VVEVFLEDFQKANVAGKRIMLKELKNNKTDAQFTKRETKSLKKVYRQELVKRSALLKIAAAWVITVPASALLSALIFYTIRGAMLP